ncbi:MAG: hypothetical protein FD170_1302 [Bacteroidetes bacterium]|nr:MAG: hypothetical protein FD170_1302 [Bacteroidota bacterium]
MQSANYQMLRRVRGFNDSFGFAGLDYHGTFRIV